MRIVGMVLGLLGGFLVMLGILARWYAPGQLMRTPLNVNSTTLLSGTATMAGAHGMQTFRVKATSITRTDSKKSDDNVAVWVNSTCVVKDVNSPPNCVSAQDPQKRLITASVDNFATDRKTALAVNDPKYLPADATPHFGLVNKWPFQAEKKSYPYWDGTAGKAMTAQFVGTRTFDGVETYHYHVTVPRTPIEIAAGVPGTYTDAKDIYAEPLTGSIIDQEEQQSRVDKKGKPVISLKLAFTPDQVKVSAEDAKKNVGQLNLIRTIVPLVGLIVGLPLLLLGMFLAWLGTRRKERAEAEED